MNVPVPSTCEAVHVVLTAESLGRDSDVPLPDPVLLRRRGSRAEAVERVARLPHRTVVRSSTPPSGAAAAALAARREALELAEAHDGVVVDLSAPRVVEHAAATASLASSSQWFALDHDEPDTVRAVGLGPFGLPDVVVPGVPAGTLAMVDAVVTGLVHRLIAEWPAQDPIGPATVTLRDIALGYGEPGAEQTPNDRSVDVLIDYDLDARRMVVTLASDPATTLFAP